MWFYTPSGVMFSLRTHLWKGYIRVATYDGEVDYSLDIGTDIIAIRGWGEFDVHNAASLKSTTVNGVIKVPLFGLLEESRRGVRKRRAVLTMVLLEAVVVNRHKKFYVELIWDGADLRIGHIHGQGEDNNNRYFLTNSGYFRTLYTRDTLRVNHNGRQIFSSQLDIRDDYGVKLTNAGGIVIVYLNSDDDEIVIGLFPPSNIFHVLLSDDASSSIDRQYMISKTSVDTGFPIEVYDMITGEPVQQLAYIDGDPLAYDDTHKLLLLSQSRGKKIVGYREGEAFEIHTDPDELLGSQWLPWSSELVLQYERNNNPTIVIHVELDGEES